MSKNSTLKNRVFGCTFKRVDLPHPLGPRSIQNCPQGIRIEQSRRMGTAFSCLVGNEKLKLRPSIPISSVLKLLKIQMPKIISSVRKNDDFEVNIMSKVEYRRVNLVGSEEQRGEARRSEKRLRQERFMFMFMFMCSCSCHHSV